MKAQLRPLQSSDLFLLVKVVKKLELSKLSGLNLQSEDKQGLGFEMVGLILDSLESAEQEIYDVLAKCSNLSKKDIQALPLADFVELVGEFVMQEGFSDTMKRVQQFIKPRTS